MKAIMYHYVQVQDKAHPNFRFLDVANFRKQLDFFERNFGFVEKSEWHSFSQLGVMPDKEGKVILTFDDALSCHFDYVFPELIRRGLWGIFYVPTNPYINGKILDVHRIHLLCGAFDGSDLFYEASRRVTEDMIPDEKRKEFRELTYFNQNNFAGVSEFKRLLNYFLDYQYREQLIDELGSLFSYAFDSSKYYVQRSGLQKMNSEGMIIGSHTVNHPVMSKLDAFSQKREIVDSFELLSTLGVIKTKTYCHPYGGFYSFDNNTVTLLESEGVSYSFNVEPREIKHSDFIDSRQFLPRYDCNLFEYGLTS
jgi:peptidoglycan/xylan/chitin deacetylase (PgdA/CDA1 family)